jgi:hypothetical protein
MKQSRRAFLQTTTFLAAALPLAGLKVSAAAERATAPKLPAPGAGLFFDLADAPRIRANLELPRFAELKRKILGRDLAAEEKFLRDEIKLTDHITDQGKARATLEYGALAFALTGDRHELALAKQAIARLSEFKDWDYFLEAGTEVIGFQRAPETTIAFCLALDWLGTELSADERAAMEAQIATKGAPACYLSIYGMKYPDRVRGWSINPAENFPGKIDLSRWPLILNATNLKIIPTCALGIAAIHLHGRHPDAARWLELAQQSAQAFATMYGSDGCYDEGAGYWGYTTMHLIMFAEAQYRRLGIDQRSLINYPGTVRYALSLAMPTAGEIHVNASEKKEYTAVPKGVLDPAKDLVNFGDSGVAIDSSIAPWVGRVHGDPLSDYVAHRVGSLEQWVAAVWYRPDAAEAAPGSELHDVHMKNDLVVSRTGWKAEDTVVALRSGGPANHEHADRNSVIFKAYGERLFHDPFKAAYIATHPRWLLRQTEAHTAVLIGGKNHQYHDGHEGTNASWAWARVRDFRTGPGWMTVTSDATEAYQIVLPDVKRVLRTLVFLKPDVLVVLDRVTLTKTPTAVQARFQVFNDDGRGSVEATNATFGIRRPGARLAAITRGRGKLTTRAGRLNLPLEEGVHPYAEVESAAALEHEFVTLCGAAPGGATAGPVLGLTDAGDSWGITGRKGGKSFACQIGTAGEVPTITF